MREQNGMLELLIGKKVRPGRILNINKIAFVQLVQSAPRTLGWEHRREHPDHNIEKHMRHESLRPQFEIDITERRLVFVCRDERDFNLDRYRIAKFLSTVLQYSKLEPLHVNLEKIDCGNLSDIVQASGRHFMLGNDVSPLRHWYELMHLARVRL